MTLPNERLNALHNARAFLSSLLDKQETPRVPKEIRKQAYYVLKHYPTPYELEKIAKKAKEILGGK